MTGPDAVDKLVEAAEPPVTTGGFFLSRAQGGRRPPTVTDVIYSSASLRSR